METKLSAREIEVVFYLARSLKITQIAEKLVISDGTVRAHLDHIRDKWNRRDDVSIVLHAIKQGIIEMP